MNLKRAYVNFNYIDEISGEIDHASVFVDQNYDSLEIEDGKKLRKDHVKRFGRRALTTQKETVEGATSFNDEELYYANRVVFKLMKENGS